MADKNIKLFENKRVRTAWDEEKEEWLFSIIDICAILTDSDYQTARNYWKWLKNKLKDEGSELVSNTNQLKMPAPDGKMRLTDVADTKQVLRLIQSIPSSKAEPFKVWLAEVGNDRINETADPELSIDRALATYLRKGYSREWINQRLQAIQVRKDLTDEWENRGVKQGAEFAILTDEITKGWTGMTTRQYKNLKGLRKEGLRDNMSMLELTLNQLAEATTTEISRDEKPQSFEENRQVAKRGGSAAGVARQAVEAQTGKPVITSKKAVDFARLLTDVVDYKVDKDDKETDKKIVSRPKKSDN
ncbi:MAG: Bro-N domain-containing protein [Candidatus Bathyarchaeota archaeon]|uniref:BRO-N domain-containing protein n=1 Tax=Candidatus Bathycorpusculum sp. TaxID=2994959 RepID=UPI002818B37C|nr:Bro-N domain-containing protein [Candidatus Termiticorpusculum sp.]